MSVQKLRIVFFGTPEFAVAQLEAILNKGYQVAAVVTAPDKPAGRGKKLRQSAIKQFTENQNLRVLQPANLKEISFADSLRALHADVFVVVAFRMLPEVIWSMPPRGTFNLHASLLPQYRGAAPINWAIINGETKTGLTTFFLNEKIDEGNIILQKPLEIYPEDDAGSMHKRMMTEGQSVVINTLKLIEDDNISPVDQAHITKDFTLLRKAPKIFRTDCRINWEMPLCQIHNHVRGLSPNPGAFTEISNGESSFELKILQGTPVPGAHQHSDYQLITDNRTFLKLALPDGFYNVEKLQMPGKKAMPISDLLRGYKFEGIWKVI